jgi:hypothetical protein
MEKQHGALPGVQCFTREEEAQIAGALLAAKDNIIKNMWFESTIDLLKTW